MSILENIRKPGDIKNIDPSDFPALAAEIRKLLVDTALRNGGHLASNLGTVELTMALHLFLDLPTDKLVWDVGHQSYTHKILTGRVDEMQTIRQTGGISGFPKRRESECDCYETGHSSTSISAGLGLVKARDIQGLDYKVVSVIGDGALTGGLAYEGLDNAGRLKTNYIIVLNDNEFSISKNVGGLAERLNSVRTSRNYLNFRTKIYDRLVSKKREGTIRVLRNIKSAVKHLFIPEMLFEDLGITYIGPIDGHDIDEMLRAFRSAARVPKAVLVHVRTVKGKGYGPAESNPERYHGVNPGTQVTENVLTENALTDSVSQLQPNKDFQPNACSQVPETVLTDSVSQTQTQTQAQAQTQPHLTFTSAFSRAITAAAKADPRVVAITAAMPDGTGLSEFAEAYPERFFDVGIAEGHAVTFAAGLAVGGLRPVVAVYSSFLQRAYDELMEDVCEQRLPVIFAIDRAGLVGADGETHQGIYDLSYLATLPGLTVLAPCTPQELGPMLMQALATPGPVAIRYPRGDGGSAVQDTSLTDSVSQLTNIDSASNHNWLTDSVSQPRINTTPGISGHRIALLPVGAMYSEVRNLPCDIYPITQVYPVDTAWLQSIADTHDLTVTIEDNIASGGYGEHVRAAVSGRVISISWPDAFIEHGDIASLRRKYGLDKDTIYETAIRSLG